MKKAVKIIFIIISVILAAILFYNVNILGVHKEIRLKGDQAYLEKDYSFFKNVYEYYKDEPLIDEEVELDDGTSFKIKVFQQANAKTYKQNYLSFLVEDFSIENKSKVLDLKLDYKFKTNEDDLNKQLVKLGDENWYLQWVTTTLDELKGFELSYENKLLYKYQNEVFLDVNEYDMASFIKGDNIVNLIGVKASNEEVDLGPISSGEELEEEKEYEVSFNILLDDFTFEDDVYLSGPFNDWKLNDEDYKLIKMRNNLYSETFKFSSKHEKLVFRVNSGDEFLVDEQLNVLYYEHEFNDKDSKDLNDYGIYEAERIFFNTYSYYKWVALAVYFVVVLTIYIVINVITNKRNNSKKVVSRPTNSQ